jgi:hypothetical protein
MEGAEVAKKNKIKAGQTETIELEIWKHTKYKSKYSLNLVHRRFKLFVFQNGKSAKYEGSVRQLAFFFLFLIHSTQVQGALTLFSRRAKRK